MSIRAEQTKKWGLVYIAGTGVSAASAEDNLRLKDFENEQENTQVALANGIGTSESVRDSRADSQKKKASDRIIAWFLKRKGYIKKTHDTNLQKVADATAHFDLESHNHLVLAGHSRGAAVGITGVITAWYQKVLKMEEGAVFLPEIDKISIIAMDPVLGPNTNNQLGIGKVSDANTPSIAFMLNKIAEAAGKPDLFDVTIIQARYDARTAFNTDQRWAEFIRDNKDIKCKIYSTGFQHSAMIKENLLDQIYEENKKPRNLIRAIIGRKLECYDGNHVHEIAKNIIQKELHAINTVKIKIPFLDPETRRLTKKFTSKPGYKGALRKITANRPMRKSLRKHKHEDSIILRGRDLMAKNELGETETNQNRTFVEPARQPKNSRCRLRR